VTPEGGHWAKSRRIDTRIVVEGDLVLTSPAHFGGGAEDAGADLALLRDEREGRALLSGASIAGALRNYWRERTFGYGALEDEAELFGVPRESEEGEQSLLVVEDAIGSAPRVELRNGVAINGATRTAADEKLFSMQVLCVGTRFPLRFELVVPHGREAELCRDLAVALDGLTRGEIALGSRKRRGFGACRVESWRVRRYDLTTTDGLLAWLAAGRSPAPWESAPSEEEPGWPEAARVAAAEPAALPEMLGLTAGAELPDLRATFALRATFSLQSSLLVRSGTARADLGVDMVQLRRRSAGGEPAAPEPVLPGTSLAGALRFRALRIANALSPDDSRSAALVGTMFGVGPDAPGMSSAASRLVVQEACLTGVHSLVQHRIRVDRFTGGALDRFLFTEAPVFADDGAEGIADDEAGGNLVVDLELRAPTDAEIGLLLLLLKDLWIGDLPLGGEAGAGRGRLRGIHATLTRRLPGEGATRWHLEDKDGRLEVSSGAPIKPDGGARALDPPREQLQRYVAALHAHLQGGQG